MSSRHNNPHRTDANDNPLHPLWVCQSKKKKRPTSPVNEGECVYTRPAIDGSRYAKSSRIARNGGGSRSIDPLRIRVDLKRIPTHTINTAHAHDSQKETTQNTNNNNITNTKTQHIERRYECTLRCVSARLAVLWKWSNEGGCKKWGNPNRDLMGRGVCFFREQCVFRPLLTSHVRKEQRFEWMLFSYERSPMSLLTEMRIQHR